MRTVWIEFGLRYMMGVLMCTLMISCADSDEIAEQTTSMVKSAVGVSLPTRIVGNPQHATTRQSSKVVQLQSNIESFRGMDHLRLYCFDNMPTTVTPDIGSVLTLHAVTPSTLGKPGKINYSIFKDLYVPIGTNRLLFYGKAIDKKVDAGLTRPEEMFYYGSLDVEGLEESEFQTTADIQFSPCPIIKSQQPFGGSMIGPRLVDLLNNLVGVKVDATEIYDANWPDTKSATLKLLYNELTMLRVCSSSLIEHFLGRLYVRLASVDTNDRGYLLAQELMHRIASVCQYEPDLSSASIHLNDSYQGYPMDIDMPAGSARIIFKDGQFIEMTADNGNLMPFEHFAYPASLWYTACSPIVVSDDLKSEKYDSVSVWSQVITQVYDSRFQEVKSSTQSIALIDQIEYAVGRLETQVQMNTGKFYDATGSEVDVKNGFYLTGLIIGGQLPVGWDFRPVTDDDNTMNIYDCAYNGEQYIKPGDVVGINHTLALETPVNRTLYVALELINYGNDFMGADGIIPAGGTFYLLSEFDPSKSADYHSGVLDRVFQQDYVTYATLHIQNGWPDVDGDGIPDRPEDAQPDEENQGLAKATNGIPYLGQGNAFELGLSVDLNWKKGLIFNPEF